MYVQLSFRKTGTMGTLASQAEIGVCVQAPGTLLRESGSVAPTPWGTGGTCPPLLQMAGFGGTVSRRTANKKLTKVY